ncbi:MAG: DNA-binding response regulator [Marinilabiliales bacterium]|nr:MAG: DNA-binding response regulator [Marinilabiliales bacterium]
MMRVVIIEDETLASERLKKMILSYDKDIEIIAQLESVEESVEWFRENAHPDLIFLDIHLEDDLSFAIFEKVDISSSIIFTTAFDEYAIKAFKLKSIDYLLKPIVQEELNLALKKYREMTSGGQQSTDIHKLYELIVKKDEGYRERFSVKVGQKIKTFAVSDVSYFRSEGGFTTACLKDNKNYYLDQSLDALTKEVDPARFFRINRRMLVSLDSIKEVHILSTSRLKLDLEPGTDEDALVSIDKVTPFKKWLEGQE